jgi:hypothetical protein
MKKLIKFFSLMFLLFITTTSCLALNEGRFVRNQTVIDGIKEKIRLSKIDVSRVDFQSVIFRINPQNIEKVLVAVPIFNVDSKLSSEAIVSITIKDAISTDDVLNILVLSSDNKQWTFNFGMKTLKPKTILKYGSVTRLCDLLNKFVNVGDNDLVFYMLASNGSIGNFDDLHIVLESSKKGISPQRFVFQKSGELKPISLVEKTCPVKSFFSSVFCSSPESQGYTDLLTSGSEHIKTD